MIQNLLMKNECIDRKNIIGFGHSQGAEFVVKLACFEPGLFKAVISGSGYYQPSFRELLRIMPIRFYWKISKYDKGIYEQGYKTGRKLKRFCKDSVNIELESMEHCWVELNDVVPDSDMTFLQWYKKVVTEP
jgi:predicted esterase